MLNKNEIKEIVTTLEEKELKLSSHLYKRFPGKLIGEASDVFSNEYSREAEERPGLVLLSTILAAHRNYTKQVEPQINRIRQMDFYSFEDLKHKTKDFNEFSIFAGMRDLEKYTIIIKLLDTIDKMKIQYGETNDYDVMKKWALKADYKKLKEDIIGRIKGVGIATFQHLRMNFGANTVKPDQRVKEVLNHEFKFYSNKDIEYISAVEYIAKVIDKSTLYVDQVFVNYGSGYYVKSHYVKNRPDTKPIRLGQKEQRVDKGGSAVEQILKYIKDSIKDLDVVVKKRNAGGYIVVANELRHLSQGKNIFTYWPTSSSVAIIILKLLPRKTYYSIEEMEKDQVATKIREKYRQMVGK